MGMLKTNLDLNLVMSRYQSQHSMLSIFEWYRKLSILVRSIGCFDTLEAAVFLNFGQRSKKQKLRETFW